MSSATAAPPRTVVRDKPRMRGRLHQVAFFAAIPAGLLLVAVAPGTKARIGAVVYAISLLLQLGASAMYHRGNWSDEAYAHMQRLDHSMIFVLIAGTYTPVCLMVLHGTAEWVVLTLVWAGAAVGIVTKLYRVDLHVISGFTYVALGWVAIFMLPAMARMLSPIAMALVIAGGILYSLGAITLATNHPDPWPETFGYHEVWHAATVIAAACFYGAILLMDLQA